MTLTLSNYCDHFVVFLLCVIFWKNILKSHSRIQIQDPLLQSLFVCSPTLYSNSDSNIYVYLIVLTLWTNLRLMLTVSAVSIWDTALVWSDITPAVWLRHRVSQRFDTRCYNVKNKHHVFCRELITCKSIKNPFMSAARSYLQDARQLRVESDCSVNKRSPACVS